VKPYRQKDQATLVAYIGPEREKPVVLGVVHALLLDV
jgi:hypothetical protein